MAMRTVVFWRDIPAQVIVKAGRRTARRVLPNRFEKAIDQAAMHAKLHDTDSYLEHWRRGEPVECGDDIEAEADAAAAALDAEFTADVLAAHVRTGGLGPDGKDSQA